MKKYILGLILCIGCIFNFTNGADIINECRTYSNNIKPNCYVYGINEQIVYDNTTLNETFTNKFTSNFNMTYYGTNEYKAFYMGFSRNNIKKYTGLFWYGNELYNWNDDNYTTKSTLMKNTKLCQYNGTDYAGLGNKCAFTTASNRNNCSIVESNYTVNVSDFVETVNSLSAEQFVLFPMGNTTPSNYTIGRGFVLCAKYGNGYYCATATQNPSTGDCTGYQEFAERNTGTNGLEYYKNYMTNSPIQGYIGGGINAGNSQNYYCPTIRQVMANMGTQYNTGLCYNGTLKYENGTITTVEKKDIFTVFSNYNEYTQRISLYNENCTTPNTTNNCQNVFSGEFEKYSIIANAINNNAQPKNLWNYCNMGLNYDLNATTCVASGYIQEQPTQQELIESILNDGLVKFNEINTPNINNTGNVLNSLLGTGQTREDIATRDILGQVEQIKDKLQTLFTNRNGVSGIIPDYILRIILLTLLLTVLLKK